MVEEREASAATAGGVGKGGVVAAICIEMIGWEEAGARKEAEFRKVLHPQLCFRRANGDVNELEDFIGNLASGAGKGRTLEGEVDVSHYDNMAVAVLVVRMPDGKRYRNARVFLRGGERGWQLVSWCNEEIKAVPKA